MEHFYSYCQLFWRLFCPWHPVLSYLTHIIVYNKTRKCYFFTIHYGFFAMKSSPSIIEDYVLYMGLFHILLIYLFAFCLFFGSTTRFMKKSLESN